MAEIFAAVASGAGLVSLSIQLLESSRKLKELYSNSREAPDTVDNLYFELETLSLQLRRLERHRQHDHLDTELHRCITICEKKPLRVREVIDQMARYIRKSSGLGRLYTAFKEPEMRKLLEDLEKAKSSLSLAYASYCQSWNIHHTSNHAAGLVRYGEMLSILQQQSSPHKTSISSLAQTVQAPDGLKVPAGRQKNSSCQLTNPVAREHSAIVKNHYEDRLLSSKRRLLSLSISPPLWLTRRTWHLAVCESQGSWTIKIDPISLRPFHDIVFKFVTQGDTMMVRKLLDAGELSIRDHMLSLGEGINIFAVSQNLS
ncbi:hypothetical protein WHR41_02781 [Cladosporium halotolerans]|uniref:Fungal N-terminal domain-containing protein n=1 Tax=Cladosporium halotolerans TaxID=1052096 RepID=A0AB34KY91_9PEZI